MLLHAVSMNVILMALAMVGGMGMRPAAPVQQAPLTNFGVLTVPQDHLPPGCTLRPTESNTADSSARRTIVSDRSLMGAAENPWIGSDRRLAAAIRQRMEAGRPMVPDGPPLDRTAATAYALKWADNVLEAYYAAYQSTDVTPIEVFAVRFANEALAHSKPPAGTTSGRRGVSKRVEIGPTVVVVAAASTSPCFASISEYVASLR